jgi:hypothetical protein
MQDQLQGETPPGPRGAYLFAETLLGGPLEELEAAAERKIATYAKVGDRQSAEACSSARDLARAKLEAVLAARKTVAGS